MTDRETIGRRIGRLIDGVLRAAIDAPRRRNADIEREAWRNDMSAMETELRRDLGRAIAAGKRLALEAARCGREAAARADEAETALAAGREHLARTAIARQIDLDAERAAILESAAENAVAVLAQEELLAAIMAGRRDLEGKMTAPGEATTSRASRSGIWNDAVACAMAPRSAAARMTGGPDLSRHGDDAARQRAELAVLRREAEIARRIERLHSDGE